MFRSKGLLSKWPVNAYLKGEEDLIWGCIKNRGARLLPKVEGADACRPYFTKKQCVPPAARLYPSTGSRTVKVLPFPGSESTEIEPWCCSTSRFTRDRPRPVPVMPCVFSLCTR